MNFSTNEVVSLDKNVDLLTQPVETKSEDCETVYEIRRCAQWIKTNDFKTVCLQFPDHLLADSSKVSSKLKEVLGQTLYILADTTYGSCCIDYLAAAHINADAVIHFGPVCFSKTSANIPYLNIYEKYPLDVKYFKNSLLQTVLDDKIIIILVDTPYIHAIDDLQTEFKDNKNFNMIRIDSNDFCGGETVVVLSNNERKLINIQTSFNVTNLFYFDGGNNIKKLQISPAIIKRRNYLIEKIKDSKTIGILIGTLGVKNYLNVIDRIKALISKSSKKYYLVYVGKPTVAKLANFPEMDVYVAVTCSMSEIYESRDFYNPIVTPFDIETALGKKNCKFSYDYNIVSNEDFSTDDLNNFIPEESDVSLLSNKIRTTDTLKELEDVNNIVAIKNDGTLSVNSGYGAGYLSERSWKGLEQDLGKTEVELATEGRRGIAQGYQNENEL